MKLLSVVLIECRNWPDGEERWKRWSRQVCDAVLGLLTAGRLRLDSRDAQEALLQLLLHSLAPSVFCPVDPLLRVLFSPPPHVVSKSLLNLYFLLVSIYFFIFFHSSGELSAVYYSMDGNCFSNHASSCCSRQRGCHISKA